MTKPIVKGWCPGALKPMMSGDGLIVRVRPMKGRLTRDQAIGLCDIADHFGNGTIDLTSRANLQVRGVQNHSGVVAALTALDLIDADLDRESKRNIIVAPLEVTDASGGSIFVKKKMQDDLYDRLIESLPEWPGLPRKMGLALDLGARPVLLQAAADFRFETSAEGMILRADGATSGCLVTLKTAIPTLLDLMTWFVGSDGPKAGRMKRHLAEVSLPNRFCGVAPIASAEHPAPGIYGDHILLGTAFGQLQTSALREVVKTATALRPTPWRLFVLENTHVAGGFITQTDDPLLRMNACPGAPSCVQGHQATRDLATQVATRLNGRTAHISGCSKGCALPRTADVAIVGTKDGYDLVRHGTAWDTPTRTGLSPEDILQELAAFDAL